MGSNFLAYSDYESGTPTNIDPEAAGFLALLFGSFIIFFLIIALIYYIFYAICLMKIAKKTNTENSWFAWIPILNIVLMVQVSQKPLWWIVLFFIPLANIIASIIVWMAISRRVQKPEWLGILMIIPPADLFALGYMTFSKDNSVSPQTAPPLQ